MKKTHIKNGTIFSLALAVFVVSVLGSFDSVFAQNGGQNLTAVVLVPPTDVAIAKRLSSQQEVQISGMNNVLMNSTIAGENPKKLLEQQAVAIAKVRKEMMKSLAKTDPRKFLNLILSEQKRSQLSPAVQALIEKKTQITGKLEVLHIDDFAEHKNSRFEYSLNVDGKKYSVLSPIEFSGRSNGTVTLAGYMLDNLVMLDGGDESIIPIATQGIEALGEQRMLVLITEMQGETSPVSIYEVNQAVFATSSPFQTYFKEQSYNEMWFTGAVHKIELARSVGEGCGSGVSLMDSDVLSAIQAQDIDLADYDRVLFVPPVGYCSGVGKWDNTINNVTYSLSESWVSWHSFRYLIDNNLLSQILPHEIGHGLGVWHANFLDCSSGECVHNEYGNYFDVMGGSEVGDFNALYKEQLGWLTPTDFMEITTTGNYSINSLESFTGAKAAKIVNPLIGSSSVLYLEKREQIRTYGNEPTSIVVAQRNKLLLNMPQRPSDIQNSDVWLIDMKPGIPGAGQYTDRENVSLGQGEQYSLPSYGLTVGPVSLETSTSTNFDIDLYTPVCSSVAPMVNNQSQFLKTSVGTWGYISLSLYNQDSLSCSPST